MKATAMAHPIQGLVKYHGMRDDIERLPYHDSISVCTAPSHTRTTVEFSMDYDEDTFIVDGEELEGRAAERVEAVVEKARSKSDAAHTVYPRRRAHLATRRCNSRSKLGDGPPRYAAGSRAGNLGAWHPALFR